VPGSSLYELGGRVCCGVAVIRRRRTRSAVTVTDRRSRIEADTTWRVTTFETEAATA